jgi:(1->4)-alpha-D-glucan 1-alpha-D-glucosylmutase
VPADESAARTPRTSGVSATYRVQLQPEFDLNAAAELVPYLSELGVTHMYCSPYLQARPGSTHGYDVVDHTQINDELGGREGFDRLCKALAAHEMGQILDVVPNHMAIAGRMSRWWWDVLKHGPDSPFERFFDIDWDPPDRRLTGKILVPILGDHYGRVLETDELCLELIDRELVVRYHDHEVPVSPGSLEQLPGAGSDVSAVVARVNSEPALLHALLERQHYRLAYWRTDLELNYRRFFDINELVALRVEESEVFERVHALALELADEGHVDGLRIDHVDGLNDPHSYVKKLRSRARHAYIVVEKVLQSDEDLPDWPVEGTTGYDFLNRAFRVFLDPAGAKPLTDFYTTFTGEIGDLAELTIEKKLKVMDELVASDIDRLVVLLADVCERHPRHRDYSRHDLSAALRAVVAELDVYRTYVDATSRSIRGPDAHRVEAAVDRAKERRPDVDPDLFEFLASLLLLRYEGRPEAKFVMRLQQTTGAVMAKAIEDTLFYSYNRMIGLNEVGLNPASWGLSVEEFHELSQRAARHWPRTMLTTSSHDTKRSEDVRARLALLSEIPDRWMDAVRAWAAHNEIHRTMDLPDRNTEYLFYQTLVGAHPLGVERAVEYMKKATKEAKRYTSWVSPDPEYDSAVEHFVRGVLGDEEFIGQLEDFVTPLIDPGRVVSLAQVLLKLTSPGVPDIYQGNELWDLSLVDPDNRRPVTFDLRREVLASVRSSGPKEVLAQSDSGAPKMFLTARALDLRRRRPEAFGPDASYTPLQIKGPETHRYFAYVRADRVAVVVPRFVMEAPNPAASVDLPAGNWRDSFTGASFSSSQRVFDLLSEFPVALLELEG